MRILIVEDNKVSSKIMERILSAYGECITADNGDDALKIINNSLDNSNYFDLIFLDIMIPNGDGKMVLSSIRTLEKKRQCETIARIIMTSSLDDSKTIIDAFSEKCDAYLVKPISKDDILAELKKLDFI